MTSEAAGILMDSTREVLLLPLFSQCIESPEDCQLDLCLELFKQSTSCELKERSYLVKISIKVDDSLIADY